MKKSIKPLLLSLGLLGAMTDVVVADAAQVDNTETQETIQQLTEQTAALQKQMEALQSQLVTLKQEQSNLEKKTTQRPAPAASSNAASKPLPSASSGKRTGFEGLTAKDYYKIIGGMPVITSPDIVDRPSFDGGELIVNFPTVGTDLRILRNQQQFEQRLEAMGRPYPSRPRLDISGVLEGQVYAEDTYADGVQSGVNLSTAELHFLTNVNRWVNGYLTVEYDDGGSPTDILSSNIFLGRAFITIGNLNELPIYGTIGQEYVDFGKYSTFMITDSTVKDMGRTKARALALGYAPKSTDGISGQIYAFQGESDVSGSDNIDTFGANLNWHYSNAHIDNRFGVGYLSNIANALGQQATGGDSGTFRGFAFDGQSLEHRVPALNVNERLSIGDEYTLIGEFVGALRSYAEQNMSFNDNGAQPIALHLEAARLFEAWGRPGAFAVGYDRTWEALALNLPEQRLSATVSYSFWHDTVMSLEYRHDSNYSNTDSATGQGLPVNIDDLGQSSDTVTAQFNLFF